MIRKKFFIVIFVFIGILVVIGCLKNVFSQNSKNVPGFEFPFPMFSIKVLELEGDSSIIVTVFPCVIEEESYMIELFDNGIIETSVGKITKKAFYGEFTGEKNIFEKVFKKERTSLTKDECKIINQMINQLDLTKISKENQKKQIGDDADQKMIWINDKAYYFCGILSPFNDITELIEQIIKCSPIKIDEG